MSTRYTKLSLIDASEASRLHKDSITLPRLYELINAYIGKSDRAVTVRHDLKSDTSDLVAYSDEIDGSPTDIDDFINLIVQVVNTNDKFYISSLVPFIIKDGESSHSTVFSIWKDQAKIAGNLGESVISITANSGDKFDRFYRGVWSGCLIFELTNNKLYMIESVSKTSSEAVGNVTINGTLEDTFSNTDFYIVRTHYYKAAEFQVRLKYWGGNTYLYQPIKMFDREADDISGPFQNNESEIAYDWDLLYKVGGTPQYFATKFWKPYIGNLPWFRVNPSDSFRLVYTLENDPNNWDSYCFYNISNYITSVNDVDQGPEGRYLAVKGTVVYLSTVESVTYWDEKSSLPGSCLTIACNGKDMFYASQSSGGFLYASRDLDGSWTQLTVGVVASDRIIFTGVKFFAWTPGDLNLYTSYTPWEEGQLIDDTDWRNVRVSFVGPIADVTSSGDINVVVSKWGRIAYELETYTIGNWAEDGFTWNEANFAIDGEFNFVTWSGTYFIATSDVPGIYISKNGRDWISLDVSYFGSKELFECISYDFGLSSLLVRTSGDSSTELVYSIADLSAFKPFYPISSYYRSGCFTVVGPRVVMADMLEWDYDLRRWVRYPRRVRWTSPGTFDFDGPGSGSYDCEGTGLIRDIEAINETILVFESTGVGIMRPTNIFDAWWGYKPFYVGPSAISLAKKINNPLFYVGDDGKMYSCNESMINPVTEVDISKYVDFHDNKPVWFGYDGVYDSYYIWKLGSDYLYLVSAESGRVSKISVYQTGLKSVFSYLGVDEPSDLLYLGYTPISDSSQCVCSYFDYLESAVNGLDIIDTLSIMWHTLIHTGENRISKEGSRVEISEIEFITYSEDSGDYLTFEMRDEDKNSEYTWQRAGDNSGSIELTTGTCIGTDTTWSYKVADGDDITIVYDTPVKAKLCAIYRDGTKLVLGTDYTVTGEKEVALSSPLLVGEELFSVWNNHPNVVVSDEWSHILDADGNFHLVLSVDFYDEMTLETYPDDTQVGLHYSTYMIEDLDKRLIIGCAALVNEFELKIFVIPGKATVNTKILGYIVRYQGSGPEMRTEKEKDDA